MSATEALLVPENEGRQEPNNFDLIRIAMAVLVVWSHAFAIELGSEENEPLSRLTNGAINSGNLGVYVFFMVSGFLITQSFDRSSSPLNFLRKRIARIYPGYLVAIALCAFVVIPAYSSISYTTQTVAKTIGFNLLLQGWFVTKPFSGTAVNGSLWSIPFEFWCYLGVLGSGITGLLQVERRQWLFLAFVAMLFGHAVLEITGKMLGGGIVGAIVGWPNTWFKVLPCFLGGMLVYRYRDILPRRRWIALASVAVIIALSWLPIQRGWDLALVGIAFPPAASYCVFYFAFSSRLVNAAKYGDFSYGTYLYAFPIEKMVHERFDPTIAFPVYIIIVVAISLAAGMASWYGVERWFLTRKSGEAKVHIKNISKGRKKITSYDCS